MTAFVVWSIIAAVVCGVAQQSGDTRTVVMMFIMSLLLPDDLFTLE
jgi:hypothetical protein